MKTPVRVVAASFGVALLAACGGPGALTPRSAPASLPAFASPGGLGDVNLYVANSGGKNGSGDVTMYGLMRGKLLQTIYSGIDRPSVVGFDRAANLIAVANTQPQTGGKSGSVALYAPGSDMPTNVLKGTSDPVALAFDATGKIYVANLSGGVGIYKPNMPRPVRTIPGGASGSYYGVYRPRLLALDSVGNVYVAQGPKPFGSQDSVYVLSVFPPGKSRWKSAVEIGKPRALLVTQASVYLACAPPKSDKRNPNGWVKVYPVGLRSQPFTITQGIRTPDALAVDDAGNLYVANLNGQSVTVYAPGSGAPMRTITQGVNFPKSLAIGSEGNLYVANLYENSISVYKPGQRSPSLTITEGINTPVSIAINSP